MNINLANFLPFILSFLKKETRNHEYNFDCSIAEFRDVRITDDRSVAAFLVNRSILDYEYC